MPRSNAQALAIPSPQKANKLRLLEQTARAWSGMSDFNAVKKIRDRAEAARKYAQTAAMSLIIQSRAAELKLRAKRRAGQILNEILPHGGNRRSSYHDGNLKLTDIGINSNQTARWRREAPIPETLFEQYVSTSNRLCQDITAQGILRLGKTVSKKRNGSSLSHGQTGTCERDGLVTPNSRRSTETTSPFHGARRDYAKELFAELKNHRCLFEDIVQPFCNGDESSLERGEKRYVMRLLAEMRDLLESLEQHFIE